MAFLPVYTFDKNFYFIIKITFVMIPKNNLPVIIDNGSGWCKAGFSQQHLPRCSFPSIVGRNQHFINDTKFASQFIFGNKAFDSISYQKSYPVQHGIVTSWDNVQKLWHYCFEDQLKVNPCEHACMLTQAPRNPKQSRQRTTEIMFQKFKVPEFYLAISAVLSLYSVGTTTGIVLDSGDGITHAVPIYEGYTLSHAIQRNDFAGRNLVQYLKILLTQLGLYYNSSAEIQILKKIKEKCCYVALDYQQQIKKFAETKKYNKSFQLPDGTSIDLGDQIFRCPQALFKPQFVGKQIPGLHQLLFQSISKSDDDIRQILYSKIVLSGGTTMFQGLKQRLYKQITALAPQKMKIGFIEPKDKQLKRNELVWVGGSILSSLSSFKNMWITKQEYEQTGPKIIHRKCF